MINAVLALGLWAVVLVVYWIVGRIREYLQVRRWNRPVTIMDYRTGNSVMSTYTVKLAPGEEIVKYCGHQQAEPVVLSTGETVACVCISCIQPLGADWILNQRTSAERVARCQHEDVVEVTAFGRADRQFTCTGCGVWVSDSTWPTLNSAAGCQSPEWLASLTYVGPGSSGQMRKRR